MEIEIYVTFVGEIRNTEENKMGYKILGYGSLGLTLLIIGMKILSLARLEGIIILGIGVGMVGSVIYLGYKNEIERNQLIKMNRNLASQIEVMEKKLRKYEK